MLVELAVVRGRSRPFQRLGRTPFGKIQSQRLLLLIDRDTEYVIEEERLVMMSGCEVWLFGLARQ